MSRRGSSGSPTRTVRRQASSPSRTTTVRRSSSPSVSRTTVRRQASSPSRTTTVRRSSSPSVSRTTVQRSPSVSRTTVRRQGSSPSRLNSPTRQAPSVSATQLSPGRVRRGNDGNYWITKPAGRSQRWYPYHAQNQKIQKHVIRHGGQPRFQIHIAPNMLNIFRSNPFSLHASYNRYAGLLHPSPFTYGGYRTRRNNTMVVHIEGNKYLLVSGGNVILSFYTREPILRYYSPEFTDNLIYPWAETESYYYLLSEGIYVDKQYVGSRDVYSWYRGLGESDRSRYIKRFRHSEQ